MRERLAVPGAACSLVTGHTVCAPGALDKALEDGFAGVVFPREWQVRIFVTGEKA